MSYMHTDAVRQGLLVCNDAGAASLSIAPI